MRQTMACLLFAASMGLGQVALQGGHAAGANPRRWRLPSLAVVGRTVTRHFELLPDYEPGNIVSRSDVEPLFTHLKQMGWNVANYRSILHKVPSDLDFLVGQLRTPAGREFMRQVGESPNVYDRLERIAWLPRGREIVYQLINQPGGAELARSLATATDHKKVGKLISKTTKVKADFLQPTGRIYTVKMLLAQLQKTYAVAKSRAASDE